MISKSRSLLFSMFSILLLAAGTAFAQPAVDQSAPAADPVQFTMALGGPGAGQVLYQSLTVGVDGRLRELRLPIGCASGTVNLEIFPADPTTDLPLAGASAIVSQSYPYDFFPEVVSLDYQPLPLGARTGVTAGDYIVIVLSNPTGSCGIAFGVAGDAYAGGTAQANDLDSPDGPSPWSSSGFDDMPFQFVTIRTGSRRP